MKPLILAIAGVVALAGGAGAGMMMGGGAPEEEEMHAKEEEMKKEEKMMPPDRFEYVKFNSQFVIPIQVDGRIQALLVTNLQLEVAEGATEDAFLREPRIRDAFLKILFDMAAEGAFQEDMFAPDTQTELRGRLLTAAQKILGTSVNAVLISDFLKQER